MHRRLGPVGLAVAAPCLWVALELVRARLLTGFPWALLGHSQYRNRTLIQVADLTGAYGVSFVVAWINSWLAALFLAGPGRLLGSKAGRRGLAAAVLVPAAVLGYGAVRLRGLAADEPAELLRVGVVQPDIPQEQKWDPRFRERILSTYARLTRRAAGARADLLVWPEAALPFLFPADPEAQGRVTALVDEAGTELLFGSPDLREEGGTARYFNSVFLLAPGGRLLGRYDKMHLVPFGEYVPLRRALFFVRPLIDRIGDLTPGTEIRLLPAPAGPCGTPVCYEIVLPGLVRGMVAAGARYLVTVTNDAWFGRTAAPYQHFAQAVFRAVENRVPVIRCANTGISGVILRDGTVARRTRIFAEAVITAAVPVPGSGGAPYTRSGDIFAWACAAAGLVALFAAPALRGRDSRS